MYKAKVVLSSEDGKEWTVSRRDYVTSDINPETGQGFSFGKPDFVDGILQEGDTLKKE